MNIFANMFKIIYEIYSTLFDKIFHWIFGGVEIDCEQLNYDYE